MNLSFTHAIVHHDTIVCQFSIGTDEGAAVIARAFVRRHMAEAKEAGTPLKKEDFRLIKRLYKTRPFNIKNK